MCYQNFDEFVDRVRVMSHALFQEFPQALPLTLYHLPVKYGCFISPVVLFLLPISQLLLFPMVGWIELFSSIQILGIFQVLAIVILTLVISQLEAQPPCRDTGAQLLTSFSPMSIFAGVTFVPGDGPLAWPQPVTSMVDSNVDVPASVHCLHSS